MRKRARCTEGCANWNQHEQDAVLHPNARAYREVVRAVVLVIQRRKGFHFARHLDRMAPAHGSDQCTETATVSIRYDGRISATSRNFSGHDGPASREWVGVCCGRADDSPKTLQPHTGHRQHAYPSWWPKYAVVYAVNEDRPHEEMARQEFVGVHVDRGSQWGIDDP